MQIFTIVDESYTVELVTSMEKLMRKVSWCDYIGKIDENPITEKSLAAALKKGDVHLYEAGNFEWSLKVSVKEVS